MAVTTRVTTRSSSSKRLSCDSMFVAGKRRRLSMEPSSSLSLPFSIALLPTQRRARTKNVSFGPPQTHLVEKLATKYNRRYLWYNKLELSRLHNMDLQRNLLCRADRMIDTENLTWRGLEDFQPDNAQHFCSKGANRRSFSRVIVEEYWDQKVADGSGQYDDEALGYLCAALSKEDRGRALERGLEDAAVAAVIATEKQTAKPTTLCMRTSSSKRRSSSVMLNQNASMFGLQPALYNKYSPVVQVVGRYFFWMLRIMMFCIFCGLFIE